MINKDEGRRIKKIDRIVNVAKSKISDAIVISQQVTFDKTVNYPYTFTMACGSRTPGPEGEGKFILTVFSRDKNFNLKEF
jgi:hypothetical protein